MPSRSLEEILDFLPWRFFKKLAFFQAMITLLAVVGMGLVARYTLKRFIVQQSKNRISDSVSQISGVILASKQDPVAWCLSLPRGTGPRITLVSRQGQVLCDNHAAIPGMENHADRPEIHQALASPGNVGLSIRSSATTDMDTLYGAVLVDPHGRRPVVMRQGIPLTVVQDSMRDLDWTLLPLLLALMLVSGGVSIWGSMRASIPLRKILRKLGRPQHMQGMDEWALVETSIDRAHRDLDRYLEDLYLENRKLGTLMESIADSILAVNKQHQVLFANAPFKEHFLPKDVQRLNLSESKALDLLEDQIVRRSFEQVLQDGQLLKKVNLPLAYRGGSDKRYYDLKIAPLKDSQERVFGAVGVFHEVTERRLAEQMREDFVTNVSHEVRTPLTSMKGHVQVLKAGPWELPPEARASLDKIESNSDRITRLFNDVLNLSVIEASAEIQKEIVDLTQLTNDMLEDIRKGMPHKKLDVRVQAQTDSCLAAPLLLEQVFTNLVVNAFKYTPEGGRVLIRWYKGSRWGNQELPGPCTILEVEDTGPGVAAEHLPRLFERFYRVDPSRSREIGGTGLGLAIVKHIMQKHGGVALVSSVPGKGTAFAACFPDD